MNDAFNFAKKKNLSLFESLEQIEDTFLSDETKEQAKKLTEMIKKHETRIHLAKMFREFLRQVY